MAWGWAAAGQLGLGQCLQGSHTVLHPTPVSFSLAASSSTIFLPAPALFFHACHVCFLLDFRSLGCIYCPLSQAIVPLLLVTDRRRLIISGQISVTLCPGRSMIYLHGLFCLHKLVCVCTTFAPQISVWVASSRTHRLNCHLGVCPPSPSR